MRTSLYDRSRIEAMLTQILAEIGAERFSGMKLLELEKMIRAREPSDALPARTQLRAAINSFRAARWPHAAPKRRS
jgi:hypothetical protein